MSLFAINPLITYVCMCVNVSGADPSLPISFLVRNNYFKPTLSHESYCSTGENGVFIVKINFLTIKFFKFILKVYRYT